MPRALFAWPAQATVARPVAKTKIYAHAKPAAALRALFVEQVESITWAYKLAPETINLPAKPDVPEIARHGRRQIAAHFAECFGRENRAGY
jgi:D-alanyl-D-alanine carboxypeptidase